MMLLASALRHAPPCLAGMDDEALTGRHAFLLLLLLGLLNFGTPRGLRLTLSALASPNFATSYQLGSVGLVDGSISYLFSSVPLRLLTPQSETVPLPELLRSYRRLVVPQQRRLMSGESVSAACGPGWQPSLLYGRLYLPQSQLEALVVRRLSPALQLQLSAVSAQHLRDGGTVLGMAQYDVGRFACEALASSDGGLVGLRAIYNSGEVSDGVPGPAGTSELDEGSTERDRIRGRLSAGGEIYYGALNKSGGVSLGARFATLPSHRGTPLTATLTLNPLMGNVAASYAVMAGQHCSLATRMEFNVFSYESGCAVGLELWRRPRAGLDGGLEEGGEPRTGEGPPVAASPATAASPASAAAATAAAVRLARERSFEAKLGWRLDEPKREEETGGRRGARGGGEAEDEHYVGVLKARMDQNLRIGILWEGRLKSLLFSLGSGIDLRKPDSPFRTVGLEIHYSS